MAKILEPRTATEAEIKRMLEIVSTYCIVRATLEDSDEDELAICIYHWESDPKEENAGSKMYALVGYATDEKQKGREIDDWDYDADLAAHKAATALKRKYCKAWIKGAEKALKKRKFTQSNLDWLFHIWREQNTVY